MFRRRRTLPPDLRDALRAAERAAVRPSRWRRRFAMLLPGALVPAMLFIIGFILLHEGGVERGGPQRVEMPAPPVPSAAPVAPGRPSMPRVIYGGVEAPAAAPAAGAFAIQAAVVDGDTLAAGGERLRLNGIDAPEMAQLCERDGVGYRCGEQARAALGAILGRGALTCAAIGVDRYDRRVVRCVNEAGQDIAAAMVAAGWALAYRQFTLDYVPQEDEARSRGRGIWAGRFDPPWEWRRRQGY